jgi:two-component system cell cycle sensor histidine kinase/response regulator CckA
LLLTDLVMPDMNGRQLAEQILSELPSMKVIFMSGYTEDALVRVGGIENIALLEKPFTAEGLIRRVRQALDQVPSAGSVSH